jgi:ankyrin repeat protein
MSNPIITVEEIRSLARLKEFIDAGADVNRRCTDLFSPLGIAAQYVLPAQCQLLLDAGANPDFCSTQGASPLAELLGRRADGITTPTRIAEVASILLNAGASPEGNVSAGSKRKYWDYPVLQAVQFGHAEIIPMLAERGANLDIIVSNQGRKTTPLTEAFSLEKGDVAMALLRSGARAVIEGSSDSHLLRSAAVTRSPAIVEHIVSELEIDPTQFLEEYKSNTVFPSETIRATMRKAWDCVLSARSEEAVLGEIDHDQDRTSGLPLRGRTIGLAL